MNRELKISTFKRLSLSLSKKCKDMIKDILMLIIIISISASCGVPLDKKTRSLDDRNIFKNNISSYIGRPIKYLILDSRYKLKYISFGEASAPFYLDALLLVFSNDVYIRVSIDEFHFVEQKNMTKFWDINKCILEEASFIELITDEPIDYDYSDHEIIVEYISLDSIKIVDRKDKWAEYRK